MDIAVRVERLVEGVVDAEGLELVHVEFQPRGANSLLRIFVDKEGGVSLADCQLVSRHVGVLLDVEDLIPHHYTLEVSSPGIERPLFKESDYERFKGQKVRLTTIQKIGERRTFSGVLKGISEGVIEIEGDGSDFEIPFQLVRRAKLVYEF